MRIVDVCPFYCPQGGGVRTYVDRKLRSAPNLGHELIVLAPGPSASITEIGGGAILHTVPAAPLPVDRRYYYFNDEELLHGALSAWKPDHVESSSPWSSASMVARWDGSASRSLVMHADPMASYAYRWFGPIAERETIDRWFSRFWTHLRKLDQANDMVISAGDSLSQRLSAGGLTKVRTVPMGVEPGIFDPSHRSESLRVEWLSRMDLDDDALLLVAAGRLSSEKRWPLVLGAVRRAGRDRAIGLVLAGGGVQERSLRRQASRCGNVRLAGNLDRPDLARLLASGDALVHGCESETFCMIASEARASGLPLIVPDRGGAFDQLGSDSGVSYPAADERALADALVDFAGDRRARQREARRGARGVRTIDQHFLELFALYLAGLPLLNQVGDIANQLGLLGGLS